MNLKPGIKTSEFWVTSATALLALLATAGLIGPTDLAPMTENVKTVVLGIYALCAILSYIKSRIDLKKE